MNANDPVGYRAQINVFPRAGEGFDYTARDTLGGPRLSGTFNTNTFYNTQELRAGNYTVAPRPHIERTSLQSLYDVLLLHDPNAHTGRPTISNTADWNTVQYADGPPIHGVQIHPGRFANGSGVSESCLICSDVEFGRLNSLFNANYGNGGVHMTIAPFSIDIDNAMDSATRVNAYRPINGWNGGPAAGGFVLYPNKLNTSMTHAVYAK